MKTNKKIHLFKDFKFVRTITADEEPALLNALCKFEYHESDHDDHTFTVLCIEDGYGFSQRYRKTEPGKAWHSHMWKHVKYEKNPDSPSFDDLVALIPTT